MPRAVSGARAKTAPGGAPIPIETATAAMAKSTHAKAALAGIDPRISRARIGAPVGPRRRFVEWAARMRRRVTFSRNLTLSLSRTCRCYCKYCAFATHQPHLHSPEEVLELLDRAVSRHHLFHRPGSPDQPCRSRSLPRRSSAESRCQQSALELAGRLRFSRIGRPVHPAGRASRRLRIPPRQRSEPHDGHASGRLHN